MKKYLQSNQSIPVAIGTGSICVLDGTRTVPAPMNGNILQATPATTPNTEPVTANGEFVLAETDVSFPTDGFTVEFTRYYRSGITNFSSALGANWSHSYNEHLHTTPSLQDSM